MGLHQFEVGARRRIDEEGRGCALPLGKSQRRTLGYLGLFHVSDGSGGGGKLGAGKRAEAVERPDIEKTRQPVFRRCTIEQDGRLWNGNAPQHIEDRLEFRIEEEAVGKDQFARLDPQDIGKQPALLRFR